MSAILPRYGLRKDGTLGPESYGRPIAFSIISLEGDVTERFLWSDDTEGPVNAKLLPIKPPVLTWREPLLLARWMLAGFIVALVGLAMVPLSYIFKSLRVKSNCLIHAFGQYSRLGGYIIFMPSKHANAWWPHVVHSADLQVYEEFFPVINTAMKRFIGKKHRRPPVIFDGIIQPWVIKPVEINIDLIKDK